MTRHVNMGFDPDSLERMVKAYVMKGVQGMDDLAGLPTKAVETLDMFQKSQLRMGGDFGLDPKTIKLVNGSVRMIVLTAIAVSLFLGACILCLAGSSGSGTGHLVGSGYISGALGVILMVYVFLNVQKHR
jgi:hypothetical protein